MHAHRPVRTTQRLEFTNLDSLIPSMAWLYLFILVATCAVFPASNMVLTFHVPMVVVTPVERMVFGRVASRCFWLSPPCIINPSDEGPSSLRGGISWFTLVCVSVTGIVLWGGVVSPTPNPQPGGPGVAFSRTSTLKPARLGKTCQGFTPAGIASRVTEVHKPPHHVKVTTQRGSLFFNAQQYISLYIYFNTPVPSSSFRETLTTSPWIEFCRPSNNT